MPKKPEKKPSLEVASHTQKDDASNDKTHHERVQMRAILRQSGVIPADAPNSKADEWLYNHGYLHHTGYKPPDDRVKKLARQLKVRNIPE